MVETLELLVEILALAVQVAAAQEALTETLVLAELLTPAVVAVVQVAMPISTDQVVRA
jgi:hypothetical protein